MRENADEYWNKIHDRAKKIGAEQQILETFKERRIRTVQRRRGEIAFDERPEDAEHAFQTNVFFKAIDTVCTQLVERFNGGYIEILKEMQYFTARYSLGGQGREHRRDRTAAYVLQFGSICSCMRVE
jgi:hypothetical protein